MFSSSARAFFDSGRKVLLDYGRISEIGSELVRRPNFCELSHYHPALPYNRASDRVRCAANPRPLRPCLFVLTRK